MASSVTFAEQDNVLTYAIESKNGRNKRRKRKNAEKHNRNLSYIERYMRKNHLLLKNEFLELTHVPFYHIRIPYIEFICFRNDWIHLDKYHYLKIVHY
jgi:hypothetical protein